MKKPMPQKTIKNPLLKGFVIASATGLGVGYAPKAPGTVGSIWGLALGFYLSTQSLFFSISVLIGFALFSVWVSQMASAHWGEGDRQSIVIDEVIGQAIATFFALWDLGYRFPNPSDYLVYAVIGASFLFFRLLDITKPFPARSFDRRPGGWGIVGDDVVAGIYAALIVRAGLRLFA